MLGDVTDTVISSIDLSHGYGIDGRQLRMRRLAIKPGGVVPWHGHATRPANIYVVRGNVTEYRSTCAVPNTHRKGEVVAESGETFHWWRNNAGALSCCSRQTFCPRRRRLPNRACNPN